jgi:hypothetical protein
MSTIPGDGPNGLDRCRQLILDLAAPGAQTDAILSDISDLIKQDNRLADFSWTELRPLLCVR